MRIAVVGAGVSGLVAAWALSRRHEVVLLEADDRVGGHTNTVDVREPGSAATDVAIDTGFIVFNTRTYPRFIALLDALGVRSTESDMSFSVRSDTRDLEYNGHDFSTLYAQRRRLLDPRFHRMVWDILRFYRDGRSLLGPGGEVPIGEWLRARRYSRAFVEDHLYPMIRAVWSANREVTERFPARFLARFFDNHGFLQATGRPAWRTIPGGARTYVRALLAHFPGQVRTGAAVDRVERDARGVTVRVRGAGPERFDHVVLACHADQALALLGEPSPLERELLEAFPYQLNEAVLHTDARVMPTLRRSWASWNVHLDDDGADGACLTYWMNRLQPLATGRDYFVTLNRTAALDPARILRRFDYAHPVFTSRGLAAQARHGELLSHRRTSYCGAYWRNGFHEDGVVSALRVCARLGVEALGFAGDAVTEAAPLPAAAATAPAATPAGGAVAA